MTPSRAVLQTLLSTNLPLCVKPASEWGASSNAILFERYQGQAVHHINRTTLLDVDPRYLGAGIWYGGDIYTYTNLVKLRCFSASSPKIGVFADWLDKALMRVVLQIPKYKWKRRGWTLVAHTQPCSEPNELDWTIGYKCGESAFTPSRLPRNLELGKRNATALYALWLKIICDSKCDFQVGHFEA